MKQSGPHTPPKLPANREQLEQAAKLLEESGEYRVLKRIPRQRDHHREITSSERVAVIVDTETTGLDPEQDEVVELGMIAIAYELGGEIKDVLKSFSNFREPGVSISPIASQVTGITWQMVAGHHIARDEVEEFVGPASLIIAHNAAFDRPMCEKHFPIFAEKPWACSLSEVDWQKFGFEGTKLAYLVTQSGWFYDAHRAIDDCTAVLQLLRQKLPGIGQTSFQKLLDVARQPRIRFWVASPYDQRGPLKSRGYRWNPGGNGRPRAWWREVPEGEQTQEALFLKRTAKILPELIAFERVNAFQRFRSFSKLPPLRIQGEDKSSSIPDSR